MKMVQGGMKWKPFSHKAKVRRSATQINRLQSTQALEMTSWEHLTAVSQVVDRLRVNYRGTIYTQARDMRPRLARR